MKLDLNRLTIVNYEQAVTSLNKSWNEAEHPRQKDGKFGKKGAGTDGKEDSNGRESGQGKGTNHSGNEEGRQDGRRDSGIAGSVRGLSKKEYPAESNAQYTYHHIEGGNSHEVYHQAIMDAKKDNPVGAFVHAYEPTTTQESWGENTGYDKMKKFVSEGGEAGFAIKDGDIVSVFHNPKGTKKGVAGHMLEIALQNGGNKLDCFDGFLPKLYSKYGFVPVARMKFDRQFAPEGWNYEKFGEPDVMFFAHNGDDIDTVRKTDYPMPDINKVPYITDYDDGAKLQGEYLGSRSGELVKSIMSVRNLMRW